MISSKVYDSLFDKVDHLAHYPWIGDNYPNAPYKLLILGDSHYTVKDGHFCQEEFDRCKTDLFYTRGILDDAVGTADIWPMYRGLYSLFGVTPYDAEEKLWKKIAFYNFVQAPMERSDAKPSDDNFKEAWFCLMNVIDIIKPDACLFIGIRGWRSNGFINLENRGKVSLVDDTVKISRCTPWRASIETINGIKTNAIAIHHTSQGFSPVEWRNYLNSVNPNILGIV